MAFFSFPAKDATVTREEFNLFHSIDRRLFTRMTVGLGRDPAETTQIIALWMWIEKNGKEFNFVYKTLTGLPNTVLDAMAEESVLALSCLQSDLFPRPGLNFNVDIPILKTISQSGINLKFFHDNRVGIMQGVAVLFRDVCLRAFEDLLIPRNFPQDRSVYYPTYLGAGSSSGAAAQFKEPFHPNVALGGAAMPNLSRALFSTYDLAAQREEMNKEMDEVLNNLTLDDIEDDDGDKEVEPHERTIFLTFSKGYPITEQEILEFITRKFGDVIEGIYMQEVFAQQPLYARLVVRSASLIPVVLEGQTKAKFTIRGKHVWARKYVHKGDKAPSASP